MNAIPAQLDQLTLVQKAIRDQFQRGGSFTGVALVLLGVVVVVVLTYFLARCQQRNDRTIRRFEPRQLFDGLLHKLLLTTEQRQWLNAVARDAKLEHPAVLLLSDKLYDRCVNEWESRRSKGGIVAAEGLRTNTTASQVRRVLFPKI